MEARDTVMSDEQIVTTCGLLSINYRKIAKAQAEISFPLGEKQGRLAGIREVVAWIKENNEYSRTSWWGHPQLQFDEKAWLTRLKKWGIDE